MRVFILTLLMVVSLFGQIQEVTITGTVTNTSGTPVSGVQVKHSLYRHVMTDADGRYKFDVSQMAVSYGDEPVRFSHPEYNAVIKIITSDKIDIVLQKSAKPSDNKRIIPRCTKSDNLVGWEYKVKINSDSKDIIEATDVDYSTITVPVPSNKKEYLKFENGIYVSSIIPDGFSWPFLKEEPNAIVYNRDIEYENQRKDERGIPFDSPVDIKAQSEGKFWRYIGDGFNVIRYSNVSEETAREFDDILDNTLCIDLAVGTN